MIGILRLMEIFEFICRLVLKGGKVCCIWCFVKVLKCGEVKLLRVEEMDDMLEIYYRCDKYEGCYK